MEEIIRGKRIVFNKDAVLGLDLKEFESICLDTPVFKSLPIKDRKSKIKELYGKYIGNAKKSSKPKSNKDLGSNDVKSD